MNIDLKNLFKSVRKTQEPAVQIASLMIPAGVEKSADERVQEMGLTVVGKTEQDGGFIYSFVEDLQAQDITVIKMGENSAVGLIGVSKMFADWSSGTSFSENLTKSGFYPSLRLANDVMFETVWEAMETVEKGESPASTVQEILKEFSEYVLAMVEAVPVEAFKFEDLKKDDTSTKKPEAATTSQKTPTKEETTTKPASKTVAKTDTEGSGVTLPEVQNVFGEQLTKLRDDLLGQLNSLTTSIDAVKSDQAGIKKSTEGLAEKITEVETNLAGLTVGGDSEEDRINKTEVKKGMFDDVLQFDGFEK
ncbi:MAG: hypothetical protein GWN30_00830 [Gammaproteobacteria bacterium]|nr:hypothetical protein [Phycisphaerae bacterium]NIW43354.1 hypothetical protein [Gammaproteobacteria bacterium]NIW97249.1 hypothetical protein [Phycisphaerae bacterium]